MWDSLVAIGFDEIWDFFGRALKEHWVRVVIPLAAAGLGVWWGRRQARKQWKKKQFLDRLNISLNTLHEGKLLIRTIFESDLEEVFRNRVAVRTVLDAAKKTTPADPILPIRKADCWFLLNSVLNTVAQKFAEGTLRRDAGLSVKPVAYVICLTCEAAGELRTRKVRAMLAQEGTLRKFAQEYRSDMPELESDWHETRVRALRILAEKRATEPHHFMSMEICL